MKMTDDELKLLGNLKAPKPSDEARQAAVLSAMDAFDAQADEKKSAVTQGNDATARPTSIATTLWSKFMTSFLKPILTMKRATMATATGVLLLPFAGVVAWNVMDPNPDYAQTDQGIGGLLSVQSGSQSSEDAVTAKPMPEVALTVPNAPETLADQSAVRPTGKQSAKRTYGRVASQNLNGVARKPALRSSPMPVPVPQPSATETYTEFDDNGVKTVATAPVSTFSIDVDTASYARIRAAINAGNLPPKDMVRVEELINYFDYSYALPETKSQPFKPSVSVMPTPWNEHTKLMHIGIKGFDVQTNEQPKANLVFLLDVSGSMGQANKLPLLIKSFRLLLQKLNPTDTVSIVTYAGRAATIIEGVKASDKATITNALENLQAGGSTGGAQGIEQAYRLAQKSFVEGGVNRVMLATDGDFNVGISDPAKLKDFIAEKRKSGIYLSVFGFGQGNYNDALMQSLAQNGNGQAAYIDTLAEAQKSLVEEVGGTLFPIATDVKIQMEFNPAKISEYRLIGYETRALKREDFNNDKVDAGDIGAGHSVTAIYELTPFGSPAVLTDPLRYGETKPGEDQKASQDFGNEIGFLKMRYKLPGETTSKLLTTPVTDDAGANMTALQKQDSSFAVAVAAFGQKLRGNSMVSDISYEQIAEMATTAKGEDKFGYRAAFVQLVRMAGSLSK